MSETYTIAEVVQSLERAIGILKAVGVEPKGRARAHGLREALGCIRHARKMAYEVVKTNATTKETVAASPPPSEKPRTLHEKNGDVIRRLSEKRARRQAIVGGAG